MSCPKNSNSKPDNNFTPEEQQEFLVLLSRMTPEQRDALKEVLKSFI